MKKYFLLLLSAGTFPAFAQKIPKPDAFAKSITAADLKTHLYIVAGAEMEGRETATAGQRKAAAYIESQFRKLGLQPGFEGGYQMTFPVYQDSLLSAAIEINGESFRLDADFVPSIAANIDGTFRFSEIVVIPSSASPDSVRTMNLAGKLVLFMGVPPQGRRQNNTLYSSIVEKGVAAILTVQDNFLRAAGNRRGNQVVNQFRRNIVPQQYTISKKILNLIVPPVDPKQIGLGQEDDGKGNKPAVANPIKTVMANVLLETRKSTTTLQSSNVIGILPGTDLKDEYLFITAHYDHLGKRDSVIFYGADDDGSGTVSVIEMAEAFTKAKAAGKGPRRTVVFMTVSGEEKGLWGSDYYSSHPVFPLDKTTADLNIDMIGRGDADRAGDTLNYVYVVGDDKLSSDLRPISEAANNKYTKLQLDYKFNDPNDPNQIYFRSDHYNFAKKGVPIIFYYDGMLKSDYHRPTDTPDKIHYDLMARRAQLVFYTAWEMANRNERLKRDIPLETGGRGR